MYHVGMGDILIITSDTQMSCAVPFNPRFNKRAVMLDGRWSPVKHAWVFDVRDERRVRDLLISVYGTDGTPTQTVTVRLDAAMWDPTDGDGNDKSMYFAGRKVIWRQFRDDPIRMAHGVVLLEGHFVRAAGSIRYPELGPLDGVVLEIKDVPASHPHLESPAVTIVGQAVDMEALRTERARLLERLAEIDRTIAACSTPEVAG